MVTELAYKINVLTLLLYDDKIVFCEQNEMKDTVINIISVKSVIQPLNSK